MMRTFGFIGIGNMGGAIAAAAASVHDPADIWVSAGHPERAAAFANQYDMVASAVIAWKHKDNYVRMYNGTEIRFRKAGRGDYRVK